jgi:long-chain acyl-CoA synthetase
MDKWEPELTLQLIQEHRITHTFFVPTMFVKLLKLDNSVREGYDVSSIRFIIHGAAPCAKDVKQAMLDWLGPVIWEMFAGTEGPGTIVSPQEWLNKPGTVGKPGPDQFRIIDEDGQQLSRGESGQIYIINPPSSTFSYYKDEEKTDRAQRDGYFTAGDIGYIDEDGYLFLTGRSAEVIIAGGVNIYPQEIDDVLIHHPAVADVGCVGVPNTQWGEEVKAVVQLQNITDASDALASELIEFASRALAKQKIPRSVDFVSQLPRSEAGKVQRKKLRDQYWQEQALIN